MLLQSLYNYKGFFFSIFILDRKKKILFTPRPPSSRREEGSGAYKKVSNAVSVQGRPKGRPEVEPSLETFSPSELVLAFQRVSLRSTY